MSITCYCYRCNIVDYSANAYFSLNNEDEQSIILQICEGILKAIQNEKFSTEISYNGSLMTHRQIQNIDQVENCIDREFNQLFRNNKLCKEVNRLPIGIWKIKFKWNDNDSLIERIIKILREWFNPFINYFQKIDVEKRNKGIEEDGLKLYLLNNLKNNLPGFDYLLEYSWKSYDDNNNSNEGDFVFASDSGIFVVVKAEWLNVRRRRKKSRNVSNNEDKIQILGHKDKISEKFVGKFIRVLGLKFTSNLDEDAAILEFVDNDEIIAKYFKGIYGHPHPKKRHESYNEYQALLRSYDDFEDSQATTSTQQVDDSSSEPATTSTLSDIAAAGYIFYQSLSRKFY
ncbi:hypothetical protein C1645_806705 [Glomus cerebriforme]|uniref:Uncharacterized protein n=1 Tax=Glomus cerebriforme TaxID=658196 RepID=A0A397SXT1_9GLOM|nr:hypothetical protein C1645_806705 [Glomus cerebriforme]